MSQLVDGFFYSSLIQKQLPYRAVVPSERPATDEPLRVLYLLHGLFGSYENWLDLTDLKTYAEGSNFLIVMPDGGDNWYTDSVGKYESYLIQDLLPAIEESFGASTERTGRAMAGNSMGGYGALKLGLRYPDLFGFAASFSGAFHVTQHNADALGSDLAPSLFRTFGPMGSDVRGDNDLAAIAQRAANAKGKLPRIYFDCGSDDEFIDANREFSSILSAAGIEHEFVEVHGGHDWTYWDGRLRHLLSVLNEHFS